MDDTFKGDLDDHVLGTGKIERITDGVAWGTFVQDFTFDLPVSDDHKVGDDVRMSENISVEETGSTHLFMIMGDRVATVYFCNETDEGFEIVHTERFTR
jgi:hypothetical protein